MTKTEKAVRWMINAANDPAHGYDQVYRWGERGDYDCSSAVITAWETAGVPVKTSGATYTGNIRPVFLRCGFKDVTRSVNRSTGAGLLRGDVLLNEVHHVAMYIGGGQEVEASINEKGKAVGGKPGDQTGKEFKVRSYRNYPWDCVLRYQEEPEKPNTIDGRYHVQAACFKSKMEAEACAQLLRKNGIDNWYYLKSGWYIVQCGGFVEKANADRMIAKLKSIGIDGMIW